MANKVFAAYGLTGGGDANLDGLRVTDAGLTTGDICLAIDDTLGEGNPNNQKVSVYVFHVYAESAPAENNPNYIAPDYSTGTTAYTGLGRWVIQSYQNKVEA